MKNPRRLMLITALCGLISLAAFILERFAMTDIYHGEPDLNLEWTVVAVTFLPILAFHILAVFAAFVAMRRLGKTESHPDTGEQ